MKPFTRFKHGKKEEQDYHINTIKRKQLHPEMLPDLFPFYSDFRAARDDAQTEVKFLCILLVCSDHPSCGSVAHLNSFFGGAPAKGAAPSDGDSELRALITRRCLLWGADVDSDAAALAGSNNSSVLATCNPVAFPYFAVTFKSQVLMEIQGEFTASALKEALLACMNTAEPEVAKEIAFAADRNARRMEHEQREAQMAAVKAEDERRERQKREAEEKKRREEQEEQDRLARLLGEADARRAAEEKARQDAGVRKALAMSNVPDVPADDIPADQITTIKLTMLCGSTATRKFLRSTPLSGLYCWAESLPQYDPASCSARAYELVAGFPPTAVERVNDVTLGERKILVPRCVVTMKKL